MYINICITNNNGGVVGSKNQKKGTCIAQQFIGCVRIIIDTHQPVWGTEV